MKAQDLKNSILQLAVQGKLVEQDPNDEPASVLLERIKAEKEQLIKEKKIKKEKVSSFIFRGEDGSYYENVSGQIKCIDDEIPFGIPDCWEWTRLGRIVYNFGQKTPGADFCYIDVGSIDNVNGKLSEGETILSKEKAPSRARKIVKMGSVIYSTVRPYLLNICVIDKEFSHEPIASTAFAVLNPHVGILNKYIFYYLRSKAFVEYVNSTMLGVAYPAINDEALYKGFISIPPTKEQERIVSKIEKLWPVVEEYGKVEQELTTLYERFPGDMKKSILQAAVQGKIVEQDLNDEPAANLIERIKAEKEQLIKEKKVKADKVPSFIFKSEDGSYYENVNGETKCIDDEIPFEIPNSWVWCRLKNCCLDIADIDHKMPPVVEEGYPYISPVNFTNGNGIDFENAKKVSKKDYLRLSKKIKPERNDIIFPRYGTIGVVRLINTDIDFLVSYSCATIKTSKGNTIPKYLYYSLQSQLKKDQIAKYINKTTQPNVGLQSIKQFLFPLPPFAEQQRIVEKVDELLTMCDRLTI
ncbi:MAG: EcoKI restriction-modification system protein HsdS [Pelotomaculum sp. PtaB.Bin104]|nr:MAG: EcoKI restriction-modification system protein HsdS [Pelotomaculum sp. PtaB.Bin104]